MNRRTLVCAVVGLGALLAASAARAVESSAGDGLAGFKAPLAASLSGAARVAPTLASPGEGSGTVGLVSSNLGPLPPFTGINIATLMGADRFYNAGYNGAGVVAANVEAGAVWGGHETMANLTHTFSSAVNAGTQTGEVDRHATWVGMMIAGRNGGPAPGAWQTGLAPGAELWSGAIATNWVGSRYSGSFLYNANTFLSPFETATETGFQGRTADVVNGSWGFTEPTGFNFYTAAIEGFATRHPLTTLVFAAGNAGPSANSVTSPGAGDNMITVGSVGSDLTAPVYQTISSFSGRGPNDYADFLQAGSAIRAVVDLVAPGETLTSAYYGGQTGGNSPLLSGLPSGPPGGPNFYSFQLVGTSFAAPIVAGGVALLDDAAYARFPANPNARDARVIRSVLMNSADKLPGWDNGQVPLLGAIVTSQSLDYAQGAGRLNLDRAFDQYLAGTTDLPGLAGGNVQALGWDFGAVARLNGAATDYFIQPELLGGSIFTATLSWFRDRDIDVLNQIAYDDNFADLDLLIYDVVNGSPLNLVAASISSVNSTEHLFITLPHDGEYMIRVSWYTDLFNFDGDTAVEYGLAWAGQAQPAPPVPEPATAVLTVSALAGLGLSLLRRRAR